MTRDDEEDLLRIEALRATVENRSRQVDNLKRQHSEAIKKFEETEQKRYREEATGLNRRIEVSTSELYQAQSELDSSLRERAENELRRLQDEVSNYANQTRLESSNILGARSVWAATAIIGGLFAILPWAELEQDVLKLYVKSLRGAAGVFVTVVARNILRLFISIHINTKLKGSGPEPFSTPIRFMRGIESSLLPIASIAQVILTGYSGYYFATLMVTIASGP